MAVDDLTMSLIHLFTSAFFFGCAELQLRNMRCSRTSFFFELFVLVVTST